MSALLIPPNRRPRRFAAGLRPRLQRLEDRATPAVFTVTTTADAGDGSLRVAVTAANAAPGADTVVFAQDVFSKSQTITLNSQITITDAVTINGPSANSATTAAPLSISGQGKTRLFTLNAPGTVTIGLNNVRLIAGHAEHGGAVLNLGETLNLGKVEFIENSATLTGGAIAVRQENGSPGKVNAEGCTFRGNTAGTDGGAIAFNKHGTLTAAVTTFTKNSAGAAGGAVAMPGGGAVTFTASSLSFNHAGTSGGGLYHVAALGVTNSANAILVSNSTLSANAAKVGGGAVDLVRPLGEAVFRNSTIVQNVAGENTGTVPGQGGGVRVVPSDSATTVGTLVFNSTVISKNSGGEAPDVRTPAKAEFRNAALGSKGGIATYIDLGGNIATGADLKIGPLLNNGGPTLTHLPLTDSPLINKGNNNANLKTDQRGGTFLRVVGPAADIGAVEVQTVPAPVNSLVVDNPIDENDGNYSKGDLSLREAVDIANKTANAAGKIDLITFNGDVFAQPTTIKLALGQITISESVTIRGPGAEKITIAGNGQSRLFKVDGPQAITANFTGLKLTGGSAGEGGAIFNVGHTVTLGNMVVTGNKSASVGGAIATFAGNFGAGKVVIEGSKLGGNTAAKDGGAAHFSGPGELIVRSTQFGENSAGGRGGAVSFAAGGRLTFDASTAAFNKATAEGGAISYTAGNAATTPGMFLVRNSTLTSNTARAGGAVNLVGFMGEAIFANSTVVFNKAAVSSTVAGIGGGVRVVPVTDKGSVGPVVFTSTVISKNIGADAPDVRTTGKAEFRHSALGSKGGIATYIDLGGNLAIGVDIRLGPLANNGGPTSTHLPLAESPLMNKGLNPANLAFDQRGQGFPRVVGAAADIGAVERPLPTVVPPQPAPTPVPQPGPVPVAPGALFLAAIADADED